MKCPSWKKKSFFGNTKKKCDFTSKYDLCDDCDTPKSWLTISLWLLIFGILKNLKIHLKRQKRVTFTKILFHYSTSKQNQFGWLVKNFPHDAWNRMAKKLNVQKKKNFSSFKINDSIPHFEVRTFARIWYAKLGP